MRTLAVVVMTGLGLVSTGCFERHRRFVAPPPPVPVAAKPIPQPEIETPPPIRAQVATTDFLDPVALQPIEAPPSRQAPRRNRPATTTAAGGTATEAHTPGTEEPSPTSPTPTPTPAAPQLSEILTSDRRAQYETELAGYEKRARDVVSRASGRRLSIRQQTAVERITTFLQQAEESKMKDLLTAVALAKRADVLAQDLLKSLR